jgi:NAD(P)-dependent dehydrogenase (short-subunit alcohol dehydrogenase family)
MEKNLFSEFDLTGKVAIVTGAGRGIGYHIALALARYGADLVVCSRTLSELEKVGKEIQEIGRKVLIQKMDVTSIPAIHSMVEASVKSFGHHRHPDQQCRDQHSPKGGGCDRRRLG